MKGVDSLRCEKCGENEANIHMKNIFNGNVVEYHICQACAKSSGLVGTQGDISIDSILKGVLGVAEADLDKPELKKICAGCNTCYEDFKSRGRLGCDRCYETFREELRPMLENMNKSSRHIGKVPSRLEGDVKKRLSIERLKREMEEAVKSEDFESAADIRDKIKELQG